MLFERCLTKRSIKQHMNYFNFRSWVQLDHPVKDIIFLSKVQNQVSSWFSFLLSIFPWGFLGILSTKETPPRSFLWSSTFPSTASCTSSARSSAPVFLTTCNDQMLPDVTYCLWPAVTKDVTSWSHTLVTIGGSKRNKLGNVKVFVQLIFCLC